MTPLHFAADRGDLRAARRLVEAGADPRALDDEGQTPADLAELCEHQVGTAILFLFLKMHLELILSKFRILSISSRVCNMNMNSECK